MKAIVILDPQIEELNEASDAWSSFQASYKKKIESTEGIEPHTSCSYKFDLSSQTESFAQTVFYAAKCGLPYRVQYVCDSDTSYSSNP